MLEDWEQSLGHSPGERMQKVGRHNLQILSRMEGNVMSGGNDRSHLVWEMGKNILSMKCLTQNDCHSARETSTPTRNNSLECDVSDWSVQEFDKSCDFTIREIQDSKSKSRRDILIMMLINLVEKHKEEALYFIDRDLDRIVHVSFPPNRIKRNTFDQMHVMENSLCLIGKIAPYFADHYTDLDVAKKACRALTQSTITAAKVIQSWYKDCLLFSQATPQIRRQKKCLSSGSTWSFCKDTENALVCILSTLCNKIVTTTYLSNLRILTRCKGLFYVIQRLIRDHSSGSRMVSLQLMIMLLEEPLSIIDMLTLNVEDDLVTIMRQSAKGSKDMYWAIKVIDMMSRQLCILESSSSPEPTVPVRTSPSLNSTSGVSHKRAFPSVRTAFSLLSIVTNSSSSSDSASDNDSSSVKAGACALFQCSCIWQGFDALEVELTNITHADFESLVEVICDSKIMVHPHNVNQLAHNQQGKCKGAACELFPGVACFRFMQRLMHSKKAREAMLSCKLDHLFLCKIDFTDKSKNITTLMTFILLLLLYSEERKENLTFSPEGFSMKVTPRGLETEAYEALLRIVSEGKGHYSIEWVNTILFFLLRPDKPSRAHFFSVPTKERLSGTIVLQRLTHYLCDQGIFLMQAIYYLVDTIADNAAWLGNRKITNSTTMNFSLFTSGIESACLGLVDIARQSQKNSAIIRGLLMPDSRLLAIKALLRTSAHPGENEDEMADDKILRVTKATISLIVTLLEIPRKLDMASFPEETFMLDDTCDKELFPFLQKITGEVGERLLAVACCKKKASATAALSVLRILGSTDATRETLIRKRDILRHLESAYFYKRMICKTCANNGIREKNSSALESTERSLAGEENLVSLFSILSKCKHGHQQLISSGIFRKCLELLSCNVPEYQHVLQAEVALFITQMTSEEFRDSKSAGNALNVMRKGCLFDSVISSMIKLVKIYSMKIHCLTSRRILYCTGSALASLCHDQLAVVPLVLSKGALEATSMVLNHCNNNFSPMILPFLVMLLRCSSTFGIADLEKSGLKVKVIEISMKGKINGGAALSATRLGSFGDIAQGILFAAANYKIKSVPKTNTHCPALPLFESDDEILMEDPMDIHHCDVTDHPIMIHTRPKGPKWR